MRGRVPERLSKLNLPFRSKPPTKPIVLTLARSSSPIPEPEEAAQKSHAFGSSVKECTKKGGVVTLLTVRNEHSVSSYLITPGQGSTSALANNLCSAIGAKAMDFDGDLDILSAVDVVGWLEVHPEVSVSKMPQSGGDYRFVVENLTKNLQPGTWVAMTLRGPTKREVENVRDWTRHRHEGVQTHYTNEPDCVIASIIAGGFDQSSVDGFMTDMKSNIPGFDLDVQPGRVRSGLALAPSILLGVAAGVGATIGLHHWLYGLGAAAAVVLGAAISRTFPTPSRVWHQDIETALETNTLPRPPERSGIVHKPVDKNVRDKSGGFEHVRKPGSYPLAPSAMMISPVMTIGTVSPHASVAAAEAQVRMPSVALLDDIGPLVGDARPDDSGKINAGTHIDAAEMYAGIFLYGTPGSGKTVMVQNLWAWNVLERVRASGKPNRPGAKNTLIAFESKGEGAKVYSDWSEHFGDKCFVIEVGDPNSFAIDLTDPASPPKERAQFFLSAMTYAFGDDAIGDRSSETLQNVLYAAMAFPPEAFATTGMSNPSFLDVAHALLGGVKDYEYAKSVAAAMATYFTRVDNNDPKKAMLGEALDGLGFLYGPSVTLAAWRTGTEAPRNKVNKLQQVSHWFSPSRPRGSWSEILKNHHAVVINTGLTTSGILVDESVSETLSAMIAYALKGSIQRHCSNWQNENRSVSIFADELALLAPSSAEVVEWLRNAGRAYGVRLTLATQYPSQLVQALRDVVKGFETTFIFQQSSPQVINDAVADLVRGGETWTSADISNMPRYHAILSATSGGQRQPPVAIKALYWGNYGPDMYRRFAIDQGYLRDEN